MTAIVVGVNHRTAPESLLQSVSLSADQLPEMLAVIRRSEVVSEAVVLSTCNRTEFYLHAERFHEGFRDVREAFSALSGAEPETFDPYLYAYYHQDAVRHLFEVTAGLDSVVLGEHEILGQVARAWETARVHKTAGATLNLLFQKAIESGKKVRSETEIGRATTSLSHAAVSLMAENGPPLDGCSVMLVGAGEIGAGVATALTRKYSIDLTVVNRTATRATDVAARLGGSTVAFDALADHLGKVDMIVAATAASEPIVSVDELVLATDGGRRSLFVLDLALPRNLPTGAADVDGVVVRDLADVQQFANRGLEARRQHLDAARAVVDIELGRYEAASSARQVAPLIGDLHGWADNIRSAELDRYASRLANMAEADRATVEAISRSIVAKMLHQPTVMLKDAAGTAKGERLADAARELFDRS